MGYTKNNKSTYSEDYYRNLLADSPDYVESQETKVAQQKLADAESNVPKHTYNGTYAQGITIAVNEYLKQNTYNYNPSEDEYYQQYRNEYMQGAKQAETDSVNMGSKLSGGFDNTYGKAVGSEVRGDYVGDISNAYETYDNFANQRNQIDRASKLQQIELLENLDNAEYLQGRDKVADYFNFLNYYNQKYETARGLDLTNFQNEWEAYATKLATAQGDYQFNKTLNEENRQFNESMDYNYANLAENNRQHDINLQYTKDLDIYNNMVKQLKEDEKNGKNSGETKRANAKLASMNLTELKKDLKFDAIGYNHYVSDEIEKMLDNNEITASEATYMLTKAGVLKKADDLSYDTQNADSFMVKFGLMDDTGELKPREKFQTPYNPNDKTSSYNDFTDYQDYVRHAIDMGKLYGQISEADEIYILDKTNVKSYK